MCSFAVQIREEQSGLPTGLEREAGCIHTGQRGGSSEQQEHQRLWCQVFGAAHGRAQPPGEQIIQEILISFVSSYPSELHIGNVTFSGGHVTQEISQPPPPPSSCTHQSGPELWAEDICQRLHLPSERWIERFYRGKADLSSRVPRGSLTSRVAHYLKHQLQPSPQDGDNQSAPRQPLSARVNEEQAGPGFSHFYRFSKYWADKLVRHQEGNSSGCSAQPYICPHHVPLCNHPVALWCIAKQQQKKQKTKWLKNHHAWRHRHQTLVFVYGQYLTLVLYYCSTSGAFCP